MDPHRRRVCSKRGNKVTRQSQISELNTGTGARKIDLLSVRMDERRPNPPGPQPQKNYRWASKGAEFRDALATPLIVN